MTQPFVVGIGGTTRPGSSSERLVGAVLDRCEAQGARVQLFGGEALSALPHYAPERPERSPEQGAFVDAVRQAHGVVIGTPGYHGGVSGLVKNAIDLLEDLRTDARVYLDERAVGCVVTAGGWQAGGVTLQSLRAIVHAMRGWPTPMGISLNTSGQTLFDEAGRCADPALSAQLDLMAVQVLRFAPRA